jgi:hypothetical protein
MAKFKSSMVMVSLGIDVLDGHERESLGEIVHLLICGLGKRNVRRVKPSEVMLVDNLKSVQQEW